MRVVSWNVNGIRACVRHGFVDFVDRSGTSDIAADTLDPTVRRQINPDQWVCFVRETSCRFTVLRGVHRFSRLRCASVLRLTCSRRARIAGRRPA